MLFSSITFLYYFLPILLIIYFLSKNKYKNLVLLIFSLLFYFLGEPKYIIILILSCLVNYYLSKLIEKKEHKKIYLIIAIFYNILQLLVFKYTDFFIFNVNQLFNVNLNYLYIVMPIGISFFTFQTLSYVIDVYNKKIKPADNLINFMTYVSLFPQLIAGPIVRYKDIDKELVNRNHSFKNFSEGIKRFVIGLSKKVLIANVLGEFLKELVTIDILSSWLKSILYTLQIYFDFSGYSDMAIGLGLMFGFHFLENFNYPLIANSITNFWRRWHISLSSFFKDYVYIPLGGNRVSKFKWLRNIFIVWFLTGFWHGASWNFIIWGLYFGIILVIEKLFLHKYLEKTKVFKYIYTLLIVIISFLIFNSNSLNEIIISLKNMFFLNKIPFKTSETIYYLKSYSILLIISIMSATPLLKIIINKINKTKFKIIIDYLEPIIYILLLVLTTAFLIDESFNPFLYFRF
ncbi:MAG: MBOAT family protein [Bacilli bacterium]|nr:MBOAT family protein [Bacilli bacterium]